MTTALMEILVEKMITTTSSYIGGAGSKEYRRDGLLQDIIPQHEMKRFISRHGFMVYRVEKHSIHGLHDSDGAWSS